MKVVLFCGGLGSRMREYSAETPKPLVPLKGRPIVCHIMDYYARFGHRDFILCLGYKGDKIREFFEGPSCWPEVKTGEWSVTCVDTGQSSTIGERLMKVSRFVSRDDMFLANYGDGLSDFELPRLIQKVRQTDAIGGFLSVVPNQSFHFVVADEDGMVEGIRTATTAGLRVNGGFFVLRPDVFDFMRPGEELVEQPFERLIRRRKLVSLVHDGFWRCVDTLKDLKALEAWIDEQDAGGRQYINLPGRRLPAMAATA